MKCTAAGPKRLHNSTMKGANRMAARLGTLRLYLLRFTPSAHAAVAPASQAAAAAYEAAGVRDDDVHRSHQARHVLQKSLRTRSTQ